MNKTFLNLGKQPITNSYLSKLDKKSLKQEFFYNLDIKINLNSFLVSIKKPVNPKKQYTDKYAHRANSSLTMRKAFKKISATIKKNFKTKTVLEIGSNDGVFLKNFKKSNVVAVEPCKNLARITNKEGYKTYAKFWNLNLSKKIIKKVGKIDVIYSANTISHIPNLKETFDAVYQALDTEGVFIFEDPYLGSVLNNISYDQFYDEHVHLFSFIAIENILQKSDLKIFNVELIKTHGGSIRFYCCKKISKKKASKNVQTLKNKELKLKLNKFKTYQKFSMKVKKSKKNLIFLLKNLKKKKKKIISYGATYKSCTIFNYCKIDKKLVDFVIDTTPNKWNKFTPGSHIPILKYKPEILNEIDYVFLGAWNFKKEILNKEKKYLKNGGKFITHVPKVKII